MAKSKFDKAAHHRKLSFYYKRTSWREALAADLVADLRDSMTLILNFPRGGRPMPEDIPHMFVDNLETDSRRRSA